MAQWYGTLHVGGTVDLGAASAGHMRHNVTVMVSGRHVHTAGSGPHL